MINSVLDHQLERADFLDRLPHMRACEKRYDERIAKVFRLRLPTNLAGFPATMVSRSTLAITTDPAPTTATLPGLILACGGLLALARRRRMAA